MLEMDTRIKLLLFLLINFMVFGLKDFILGTICFALICILSCFMGQKKIVLKYIVFYVAIVIIQEVCAYTPQAIETILSIFTFIYPCYDTGNFIRFYLYSNNKSKRTDCGNVFS